MHKPDNKATVEGWEFRRCRCGFVLALSPRRKLYWVRAKGSIKEIGSREELQAAVDSRCRIYDAHRRQGAVPPSAHAS
jgi:hypothetical protein